MGEVAVYATMLPPERALLFREAPSSDHVDLEIAFGLKAEWDASQRDAVGIGGITEDVDEA